MKKWSILGLSVAGTLALLLIGLITYTGIELARFQRAEARRTTFLYAAGQPLVPGLHVRLVDLRGTLSRLKYVEINKSPTAPGQFSRAGQNWEIFLRGVEGAGAARDSHLVRLEIQEERIAKVMRDDKEIESSALEPEVLTSVGDQPGEESRPIRLGDVPLPLVSAVLSAEDHRFFDHRGLDVRALFRAAWANLKAGKVTQGGSTITQQLIKNRLLTPKRTFFRKMNEAWLSQIIEWRYPKTRILEAYLNEVYLGQRGALAIRGVSAAARAYFGKEAHQLTLGESALLAGMIRGPNSYSPTLNPHRALERRNVVLGRMRELQKISDAEYQTAKREALKVQPLTVAGQPAPYFTDYARDELERRFDEEHLSMGSGARVFTTLDLALQRFAETAVSRGLSQIEARVPKLRRRDPAMRLQAALIALDPATGRIRALVGGRDYQASQFNRAILARRQPGSAFKPFVYLAALRPHKGGAPAFTAASFIEDSPITLVVGTTSWTPRNYDDRYEGRVSVRRALEQSLNAATVRLAQEIGLPAVIETARALGIHSDLKAVPALALGAFEVTPIELARAYLPLSNGGTKPERLAAVSAVYDGDGSRLLETASQAEAAVPPAEAYVMTSLLEGVIKSGTGAAAQALGVPGPVAGKTGTTNDGRDAWFVGYSSNLLTLVWVGFDHHEPHGLSGADAALPIWADFMRQALDAYPPSQFSIPPGVVLADIDQTNGKVANRFCPIVAREAFLDGTVPEPCQDHGGVADQIGDWWKRLWDWFKK